MQIKSIETENFRAAINAEGNFEIKATTPMAKALLRLRKVKNPMVNLADSSTEFVIAELQDLEASTAKLAAI